MSNIFERSLIRVGDGGLTLIIPKSWATAHHLEPGDVVRFRTNRKLVVEPVVLRKWKRKRLTKAKGDSSYLPPRQRGIERSVEALFSVPLPFSFWQRHSSLSTCTGKPLCRYHRS